MALKKQFIENKYTEIFYDSCFIQNDYNEFKKSFIDEKIFNSFLDSFGDLSIRFNDEDKKMQYDIFFTDWTTLMGEDVNKFIIEKFACKTIKILLYIKNQGGISSTKSPECVKNYLHKYIRRNDFKEAKSMIKGFLDILPEKSTIRQIYKIKKFCPEVMNAYNTYYGNFIYDTSCDIYNVDMKYRNLNKKKYVG